MKKVFLFLILLILIGCKTKQTIIYEENKVTYKYHNFIRDISERIYHFDDQGNIKFYANIFSKKYVKRNKVFQEIISRDENNILKKEKYYTDKFINKNLYYKTITYYNQKIGKKIVEDYFVEYFINKNGYYKKRDYYTINKVLKNTEYFFTKNSYNKNGIKKKTIFYKNGNRKNIEKEELIYFYLDEEKTLFDKLIKHYDGKKLVKEEKYKNRKLIK